MNIYQKVALIGLSLLSAILVGLRLDTGTDWSSYLNIYNSIATNDIYPFPSFNLLGSEVSYKDIDPGYWLVNKISYLVGGKIYLVNFICAVISLSSCYFFCSQQRYPLLSFLCLSYIIVFIGMNYTRQVVAFSLNLVGIIYLTRKNYFKFCVFVLLAASFHYIALIMLILVKSDVKGREFYRNKYFQTTLILLGCVLAITFINKIIMYFMAFNVRDYFPADYINYFLTFLSLVIFFKYKKLYSEKYPNIYPVLNLSCKLAIIILAMCAILPIGFTRLLYYFNFVNPLVLANFPVFLNGKTKPIYISTLTIIYIIYMVILFGNIFSGIVFEYHNLIF